MTVPGIVLGDEIMKKLLASLALALSLGGPVFAAPATFANLTAPNTVYVDETFDIFLDFFLNYGPFSGETQTGLSSVWTLESESVQISSGTTSSFNGTLPWDYNTTGLKTISFSATTTLFFKRESCAPISTGAFVCQYTDDKRTVQVSDHIYVNVIERPVVPLPASAFLLLGGLGALAVARRKTA
jgi:hypothetical protein